MKKYGVVESWNKVFAFNPSEFWLEALPFGTMINDATAPLSALCVRNNGEVLLVMNEAGKGHLFSLVTGHGEDKIYGS
ncbi:hypothetical protein GYH30_045252 [Glycine max]|nr:hypothetical protein GYH30_045252 [Glycine max]